MLHSVRSVRVLFHSANASTRKRNDESAITEPVKLASKRKSTLRDKPKSVDGLFKANSIIKVLCKAFSAIVIDIDRSRVEKSRLNNAVFHEWILHIPKPGRGRSNITSHASPHV